MSESLIVVNAGSSSLKFNVYQLPKSATAHVDELAFLFGGQVSGIGTDRAHFIVKGAVGQVLEDRALSLVQAKNLHAAQDMLSIWLREHLSKPPIAVGHRIVHGGPRLKESVVIDETVLAYLEELAPLAPLHQQNNLAPVKVIRKHWPELVQVACLDTAFHAEQPALHKYYALPQDYFDFGVRRYGFHGLSYQYITEYLQRHLPEQYQQRTVVAHLGSGCSACMIQHGQSVISTMGFTALDGLPMSTRPGQLDAGVVLWWMQAQHKDADAIQDLLYNQSGLKGLSGLSGDMRTLLASEAVAAQRAIDYFALRTAMGITELVVPTQGLDNLVFTAGVGENSPQVRARICEHLAWLGVEIDPELNTQNATCISTATSAIKVWVIPTNEELVIARETLKRYHEQRRNTDI